MDLIGKDNHITCAIYAKKSRLLDTPVRKRFKRIIERENKFDGIINQVKISRNKIAMANIQYGIQVPQNHQEAMDLDRRNGNQKCLKVE